MRLPKRRHLFLATVAVALLASGTAAWADTQQHRRSSQPDAEEVEAVVAQPASSTGSCGVERWSVKTGTDADASKITLQSTTPTTIANLGALAAPASLPANNRVLPTEATVYRLSATLTQYKLEADSDYHLVLSDGAGHTMIGEIPDPACVGASSPLLTSVQKARSEFDAKYNATGSFQTANVPVTVTGVAFFDFLHGQTGVAPNGVELHSVLDVQFGTGTTPAVPRPDHTVVVMMENRSYSDIIGAGTAPYINSLANTGATFTQSFGVSHPSEPNYLALFSGSTQGLTSDSCPHTYAGANLGAELIAKGLTFTGYSESMPSNGYTGCTSGTYARKHNPWVNFSNVPAASNLPFSSFPGSFSTLPTLSFVVPNLSDDMHDGTIAQGDAWLQQHLDAYAQWAKTHNSLLVLTWDEDDNSANNQIPTILFGAQVKTGSYAETIKHYNVLRTLEDAYGLTHAGAAATATPITDAWSTGGTANTVTVTKPGSQTSTVGVAASLQVNATDSATGQSLTYSASGLPTGLSINAASGLITGTPTAAGTSSVTITARDTTTASGSAVFTWTVNPAGGGCTGQLLGNPGFETGAPSPWSASSGVISASTSEAAHTGTWKAWLDGYGATHSDTLSQQVSIPAGCAATLSFWLHIDTAETGTTVFDTLSVKIGTTTLATYSNTGHNTGYTQHSINATAYAGQTVTITITGTEDFTKQTSFVLDDTTLNLA